jgi:hypothetical protein
MRCESRRAAGRPAAPALRDGAFGKAWSLDVLEAHVASSADDAMLREANRVLAMRARVRVHHVRKNGLDCRRHRLVNQFAAFCERLGLLD